MTSTVAAGDGSRVRVEVCVEDVDGAVLAENRGADRVELCVDLAEGGLTPSAGLVAEVLRRTTRVGVQVLLRSRAGDFTAGESELRVLEADIAAVRALADRALSEQAHADRPPGGRAVGFVLGVLRADRTVDEAATARLVRACGDAPVTFHRAFDLVPDPLAALEAVARLGIARVLTSGGAPTALAGADALAGLVRAAGGRVTVLAGGGVRPDTVAELVTRTGVREVHFAARRVVPAPPPSGGDDREALGTTAGPRLTLTGTPVGVHHRAVPDREVVDGVLAALATLATPAAPAVTPAPR